MEDAWRLLADGEDAQRAFAQKAGDEPWKFYNFQPALRTTVMETIDGLRQLGHLYSKMAADDAERARLRAQLDDPRKLVKLWPHLAEQLEELPSLLDRVREEGKKYNHDPRLPRFLAWAQSLLLGRSGLTVAEALDVADQVDQATSMAKVWPASVAEAVQCGKDLDLIKIAMTGRGIRSDHHDFTVLAQTKGKLSEVVSELWSAENATDLAGRETEKDLETARAMVNSLRHYISAPLVPAGSTPTDELGQHAAAAVSSVRRALESASTPAEEAAAEAKKRRKRNTMILCILAIVALWAGLVANYFDKPFGTPRDYLTILVWGFAAQTTLEALAAAADRLRSKLASP